MLEREIFSNVVLFVLFVVGERVCFVLLVLASDPASGAEGVVMTPPNEHTSEGGRTIEGSRTTRDRPYPVLKAQKVKLEKLKKGIIKETRKVENI